jgi:hypothetical protein
MSKEDLVEILDTTTSLLTHPQTYVKLREAWDKGNARVNGDDKRNSPMQLIQDVFNKLQTDMIVAIGYDADYGVAVLGTVREVYGQDTLVMERIKVFQDSMKMAVDKVVGAEGKSYSRVDDGTTKVISVKHSQPNGDVDDSGKGAPSGNDDMDGRGQREALAKAKQMAVLQQDILAQLLSWSAEERQEQVAYAETVHRDFVAQAMAIESIEERKEFLLTVNPDVQRTLILYKVWEDMKASNGGKAPEIQMNKDFVKK